VFDNFDNFAEFHVIIMPSNSKQLAKISSKIKGHHYYNYEYFVGENVRCAIDKENKMSSTAISVLSEEGNQIIGHLPNQLASKIYSSFEKGVITEITGTNCGGERTAAEGKWAQGGGIELPCVFKLYGDKSNKLIVKNKLR